MEASSLLRKKKYKTGTTIAFDKEGYALIVETQMDRDPGDLVPALLDLLEFISENLYWLPNTVYAYSVVNEPPPTFIPEEVIFFYIDKDKKSIERVGPDMIVKLGADSWEDTGGDDDLHVKLIKKLVALWKRAKPFYMLFKRRNENGKIIIEIELTRSDPLLYEDI